MMKLVRLLPDKIYLSLKFYNVFGRFPNWKNPQTYSEKLQWLKLYDRRPEYTKMVDKYAVKKYVADLIGEEYIIPTLGVWDRPEDIDWDKLPNQFVLKTTHGGGNSGVVICKDKNSFDKQLAEEKLNGSLRTDLYKVWREWPYKNVPKRIIAEKYIESQLDTKDLPDYKFFCFNGEVKMLYVATGRQKEGGLRFDFFDKDFHHLPFYQKDHPNSDIQPIKPVSFDKMKVLAGQLSKGLPHVRVDFYEVGDKVFFGEMTFYSMSGMTPYIPSEWDSIIGGYLSLPNS